MRRRRFLSAGVMMLLGAGAIVSAQDGLRIVPLVRDEYVVVSFELADVYSEFSGRTGLLLIERNGAGQFEVHPTNAGHRAMAAAFEAAHQ